MAIDLVKNQKIDLSKGGLDKLCVGINWGAIESKGFFGGNKKSSVDLDASALAYDSNKTLIEEVSYRRLNSSNGSIKHSGDDLTGDVDGDDGLDNEVIVFDLNKIPESVESIFIVLHSFSKQDFASLPFASLRIYEGTPDRVDEVFANFNLVTDNQFSGKISAVLGKIYKRNGEWKFNSIGDGLNDANLDQTITTIKQKYL